MVDLIDVRARQQAAIAAFGLRALGTRDVQTMLDDAVAMVAEVLEVELCGFMEALPHDAGYYFRAGVGWHDGVVGATVPMTPGSAIDFMLHQNAPVVYEDLREETRFVPPKLLLDYGVRGGAGVVVQSPDGPIGVMGLHTTHRREFTQDDANFLQAIANILAEAIVRSRAEDRVRIAYETEHKAAEQLRALDEMKNSFLQAVSHELRTPLAAVVGVAEVLRKHIDRMERSDRDQLLERLVVNAKELDMLLADLLDLDRLRRRTIELSTKPTNMLRLIRRLVIAQGTPVNVSGEEIEANVDRPKVERIIDNLIRNAMKHTPPGTHVWARVERSGDGVLITIEDDGPGIPDDLKIALFEPFQQGPSAAAHQPGAGIGLSLVKSFAALHGGRAWADDRPGGGAAMRVWLPYEVRAPEES